MPKVGKSELKQRLLQAALTCFAQKGYHATTVDEIATEAGVSKGAVYWHYKDKRELFLSVMRERGQALQEAGAQAVASVSKPQNVTLLLRRIMEAIFQFYAENLKFASLLGLLRSGKDAPFGEELYLELQAFYRSSRSQFAPLFSHGIKSGEFNEAAPEMLAVWLLATIDGIVMQWVIDPEEIKLETIAPRLSEQFVRAIQKTH